jgi:hypothetical protein
MRLIHPYSPVKKTIAAPLLPYILKERRAFPAIMPLPVHGIHIPFNKLLLKILLLLAVSLATVSQLRAQQEINYTVHANIIYRFTKYVDWPADKKTGDFVIGIVGDTPLYDELKTFVSNKKAGIQKIVITRVPPAAPAFFCHILFISDDESDSIKKIVARMTGVPTLIISETDGLAYRGSCINFTTVHEKLKLEINKNNLDQRHLGIATELLNLGVLIK